MPDGRSIDLDHDVFTILAWLALIAVLALVLFVEPWLQDRGLGHVALLLYATAAILLLPSLIADLRHRFG